jgi:hypothetical protein
MRHISITACLSLVVLVMACPTATVARTVRHKTHPSCNRNHTRIITADAQAVIYRTVEAFEPSIVYGCTYSQGHPYKLGEFPTIGSCGSGACGSIGQEVLAGQLVAYEHFSTMGREELREDEFLIIVRNVRNGHVLRRIPTGISAPGSRLKGAGPTTVIALKSDGAVAWINEHLPRTSETEPEYEVHAYDKTGNRVLAAGTNIAPNSLALAGSTLYWTQEGKPFSATLH